MFNKPILQTTNPYRTDGSVINKTKSIYHGEVISIEDENDGGRIKVRIDGVDNKISNNDLPFANALMPKFFHVIPQVGELVRVFIEDVKYPQGNRFWLGSVISQPHKISYDSKYTALSTTCVGVVNPDKAPSSYPDAKGVFPNKEDVGIIGKVNTDILLKINEIHLRAGKHEDGNVFKLNIKNPAQIGLFFDAGSTITNNVSSTIISADKIAIISHDGNPQFKTVRQEQKDRDRIFSEGHPIPRGDYLVQALEIIRNAIITHIHGYSNLGADKDSIINELEKINFENILQKNIIIN